MKKVVDTPKSSPEQAGTMQWLAYHYGSLAFRIGREHDITRRLVGDLCSLRLASKMSLDDLHDMSRELIRIFLKNPGLAKEVDPSCQDSIPGFLMGLESMFADWKDDEILDGLLTCEEIACTGIEGWGQESIEWLMLSYKKKAEQAQPGARFSSDTPEWVQAKIKELETELAELRRASITTAA